MIVCVCNNVSDHSIRKAVDAGMDSMLQMRLQLQVGTDCGKCHPCAKRVLRESLEQASQSETLAFQPAALAA